MRCWYPITVITWDDRIKREVNMSTHKNIDKICVIITILAVIATILFMFGKRLGIQAVVDEDSEAHEGTADFTAKDLDGDWDTSTATVIKLSGTEVSVSGTGAYSNDGSVYISAAGDYVISGNLTNGQIVVDTDQSSKVRIMLDGVSIYCEDDAALRIDQADKVFVTLAEGSTNSLESGSEYSEASLEDNTGGAVFTHDDLTINGSGALTITASYKHGIDANDSLVITGGNITVTAPGDGIHVNDDMRVCNADITLQAADDAITVGNSFMIESGSVYADGCYEGIEARTIEIRGGDIELYPEDDGLNANGEVARTGFGKTAGAVGSEDIGSGEDTSGNENKGSGLGIGSSEDIGSVVGTGPGEDADSSKNTASVADSGEEDSEDGETWIHISGGNLTVVNDSGRDADGLDSNGDIIISGGTVRISMTGTGSNNAIDWGSESGGVCRIDGGDVIACGGSSMAESIDTSSAQCVIMYIHNDGAEAGSEAGIRDSSGNTVMSWEVPCSYSVVYFSSPELKQSESYTVYLGSHEDSVTIEETSAAYGDELAGGFGGGFRGGFGGGSNGDFDGDFNGDFNGNLDGEGGPMGIGNFGEGDSDGTGKPMGGGHGRKFEGDGSERPEPPDGMNFSENGELTEPPEGMNFSENSELTEPHE